MAFNLENMSVDYKKMFKMVPTQRVELAQSGVINDFLAALTPGQLVNLFPRYYREQLPDVGQINKYAARLDGALSGGAKYQSSPQGGSYTPTFGMPPSKTAQELAVEDILKQNGIQPKESVTPGPKETGFFGAIMKAEGTDAVTAAKFGFDSPYNTVLGYGKYGLPEKPLTDMTISEVYNFQRNTLLKNHGTSSAAGAFQIVSRNIVDTNGDLSVFMQRAGLSLEDKFDAAAQRKLAYEIYKEQGLGAWEGFKVHPDQLRVAMAEAQNIQIESAADQIQSLESLQKELIPLAEEIRSQLDAKTLEIYDKAPPEEKWNIEQAIKTVGVDEFKNRIDKMAKTTTNVGTMAELIVDDASGTRIKESQAGFRKLPIKPELRNAMEYAAEQSGVYIDVFSGGQDKEIHDAMEASGQNTSFRHNVDIKGIPGAADVILYIKDENGKVIPLSATNSEHAPYIAKFTESFSRVIPSAGIGANYMLTNGQVDPRKLHVGGPNAPGAPPATWGEMPDYLAEAHARGVAARAEDLKNDFDPLKDWQIRKEEAQLQKAKEEAEAKANASPVQANLNQMELANTPVSSFATGGEIVPGENIAGINMNTGNVEFMANDRERIRIDPAELENTQQIPTSQSATENAASLERPIEPVRERNPQIVPQPLPDPQMFDDMAAGYTAIPPSQIRAANRAKLYGETSSSLINGHFS